MTPGDDVDAVMVWVVEIGKKNILKIENALQKFIKYGHPMKMQWTFIIKNWNSFPANKDAMFNLATTAAGSPVDEGVESEWSRRRSINEPTFQTYSRLISFLAKQLKPNCLTPLPPAATEAAPQIWRWLNNRSVIKITEPRVHVLAQHFDPFGECKYFNGIFSGSFLSSSSSSSSSSSYE